MGLTMSEVKLAMAEEFGATNFDGKDESYWYFSSQDGTEFEFELETDKVYAKYPGSEDWELVGDLQ